MKTKRYNVINDAYGNDTEPVTFDELRAQVAALAADEPETWGRVDLVELRGNVYDAGAGHVLVALPEEATATPEPRLAVEWKLGAAQWSDSRSIICLDGCGNVHYLLTVPYDTAEEQRAAAVQHLP